MASDLSSFLIRCRGAASGSRDVVPAKTLTKVRPEAGDVREGAGRSGHTPGLGHGLENREKVPTRATPGGTHHLEL